MSLRRHAIRVVPLCMAVVISGCGGGGNDGGRATETAATAIRSVDLALATQMWDEVNALFKASPAAAYERLSSHTWPSGKWSVDRLVCVGPQVLEDYARTHYFITTIIDPESFQRDQSWRDGEDGKSVDEPPEGRVYLAWVQITTPRETLKASIHMTIIDGRSYFIPTGCF